jgi:hypothetical protein
MRKIMICIMVGVAILAAGCTSDAGTVTAPPSTLNTPGPVGIPSTLATPTLSSTVSQADANGLAECAETRAWGTGPQTAPVYSTDALYLVRAGKHDCFDRVVFDVNGRADVGYAVHYVPVVAADASGEPVPVPGSAALEVVVHAPEQGYDDGGHQPGRILAKTGDYFYTANQLAGWRSLRAVRFAGFFEGQCTFAVGVSTTLPFRVSTEIDTTNQIRRVILDIAHEQ